MHLCGIHTVRSNCFVLFLYVGVNVTIALLCQQRENQNVAKIPTLLMIKYWKLKLNVLLSMKAFKHCLNQYVLETSYYEYVQENGPLEEDQLIHK